MPHKSYVDEVFHQFSHKTGKADWSVAVSLRLVLAFLSMGITMASRQTCGTVPVLHPSFNSHKSFFLLRGHDIEASHWLRCQCRGPSSTSVSLVHSLVPW